MTLSYTLTFDDYSEANLGQTPQARKKVGRGIFGWVLFIALAVMIFLLLNANPSPSRRGNLPAPPPRPAAPYLHRLAAAAAPAVLIAIVMGWSMRKAGQKSLPKPWDLPPAAGAPKKKKPFAMGVFAWLLFMGLAVMLFMLQNQRQQSGGGAGASSPAGTEILPTPSLEMFDFLIGIVPFAAVLLVLIALGQRGATRQLETTWEAQPFLHRPQTVEAAEDGIALSEPLSRRSYDWSYFAGFKETANLLLLYHSPYAFHIVPKRAFASEADYDVFRGYLLSKVKHGYFLPQSSAFPVIPMARRSISAQSA